MLEGDTFSEAAPSERADALPTQDSFYSEYGTALSLNSEASSSLAESSIATSSFTWEVPERSHTIHNLQPYLENLLTPAEQDRIKAQHERFRPRRSFAAVSDRSSFSSGPMSSMRSSFGSYNVRVTSSFNSFAEEGEIEDKLSHKISTIPEHHFAISTADTLPKYGVTTNDSLPVMERGGQSVNCSFASFGGGNDLAERIDEGMSFSPDTFVCDDNDGSFADDWPARDAKLLFRPTTQAQVHQGSAHRRDDILSHYQQVSLQGGALGVV